MHKGQMGASGPKKDKPGAKKSAKRGGSGAKSSTDEMY